MRGLAKKRRARLRRCSDIIETGEKGSDVVKTGRKAVEWDSLGVKSSKGTAALRKDGSHAQKQQPGTPWEVSWRRGWGADPA